VHPSPNPKTYGLHQCRGRGAPAGCLAGFGVMHISANLRVVIKCWLCSNRPSPVRTGLNLLPAGGHLADRSDALSSPRPWAEFQGWAAQAPATSVNLTIGRRSSKAMRRILGGALDSTGRANPFRATSHAIDATYGRLRSRKSARARRRPRWE